MKKPLLMLMTATLLSGHANAELPSLITNNPFGKPEIKETQSPESLNQPQHTQYYNLRGFFTWKNTTQFILEDKNTKKTIWIPRDGAKEHIDIVNWDDQSRSLVININGYQTSLSMVEKKPRLDTNPSMKENPEDSKPMSPASMLRRPRKKLD